MLGLRVDFAFTYLAQIFRTAQLAGNGAAELNMRLRADGRKLKHGVKRRHFEHADIGHIQHLSDVFNHRTRGPAVLFLAPPEQGNNG